MHLAGKISATLIVIVAFVIGLVAMSLRPNESPTLAGAQFMAALAEGDAEALTELSYRDDLSKEEMLEMWTYTTQVVAVYFTFTYGITGESKPSEDTAVVSMDYAKRAGMSGSYDERYELPMKLVDGKWKVEVFALNRKMFPGLPLYRDLLKSPHAGRS